MSMVATLVGRGGGAVYGNMKVGTLITTLALRGDVRRSSVMAAVVYDFVHKVTGATSYKWVSSPESGVFSDGWGGRRRENA